jgi:predicted SprT family Zn-dependent metalloprotease
MDKNFILSVVNREAKKIWQDLAAIYPRLRNFRLNNRLYRTAGYCRQDVNCIDLGTKFFLYSEEYRDTMLDIILPHEIIHQADFFLFGESDKKCGHGTGWRTIMEAYGLSAEPFHQMEITR